LAGLVVEDTISPLNFCAAQALGATAISTVAGRAIAYAAYDEAGAVAPASACPLTHNLPGSDRASIGREPQIAALRQLLSGRRL